MVVLRYSIHAITCIGSITFNNNNNSLFAESYNIISRMCLMGRESSASIATRYGLDGLAIDSRWGRDLPILCKQAWCPPSLLHNGYRVSLPGKKWSESGVDHPILSGVMVKERVQLYFYSPSGPS